MKIVSIVGARPQLIKAAAVSRAIDRYNLQNSNDQINEILIHTGQHYDYNMSQIFFDQLKIHKPQHHLGVGSGNHGKMTGRMLAKIEEVLLKERPDYVLVYGDTNSTLAGALAATKLNIPVVHVEAGLRSFNRRMPEEINRVITDHISSFLFCPTETAVMNLEAEGIHGEGAINNRLSATSYALPRIVANVGDVMYDAYLHYKSLASTQSDILSKHNPVGCEYCLATVHRQENTDNPERLSNIFFAFRELATREFPIILPLHPRTVKCLKDHNIKLDPDSWVNIIPPVNYIDMIALECSARIILTDSGGMQKEAYFAGVPCITLRDETEWVETIEAGANFLAGANKETIHKVFDLALKTKVKIRAGLYGEGNASQLILRHLTSEYFQNNLKFG